jgi:hypothetical protein
MSSLVKARGWNRFLWIAGSAHFALFYTLNTRPMLDIALFTTGRERIPFQYRALTAGVFFLVDKLLVFPAALQRRLPPSLSRPDEFAMLGIAFAAMLVAVYATRKALEKLTDDSEQSRWWALLVIFMAYFHYLLEFGHPCCTPLQLPYDLPSVAFFALGMWAITTEIDWVLYPPVLVAVINRESVVFLVGIYFLYSLGMWRDGVRSRERFVRAAAHALALTALCLATMTWLHHVFSHATPQFATMGPFENHVVDNIGYLLRPYYWTSYLSLFGFSWLYVYANWRRVPHAGIRWALGIGPIMLAAMYVVGVLSEIRIFGELICLFVLALALLLRSQWGAGAVSMDNE